MPVKELIEKLQEYPSDMEVECIVDIELNEVAQGEFSFGPVSSVEMYNDHGNTVRLS